MALLLECGARSGKLRTDITAEELLRTMIGIFYADGPEASQASSLGIIDIIVDGLQQG